MAIASRIKCPNCGEVLNLYVDQPCTKCQTPLKARNEGEVYIYRMGSPIGFGIGYGIYVNSVPTGHISNKETLRLPLPYGQYAISFTCAATRRSEVAVVTLSPENPSAYIKASIRSGFWSNIINTQVVSREEMPPLD